VDEILEFKKMIIEVINEIKEDTINIWIQREYK
jgi:hypothetical protein